MKHGDFTGLAEHFAASRPGYSELVLETVLNMCPRPSSDLDVADVGAGTGIWTAMLANAGVSSVFAIEPNPEMREQGMQSTGHLPIQWINGTAESTGLMDDSLDLLTVASALHWTNFDQAVEEALRVLHPGALFVPLWNPRIIHEESPIYTIELYLDQLFGQPFKRVSSGFSEFTHNLSDRLRTTRQFSEISYIEDEHTVIFDRARYIRVWKSVNDIRVQLGEERFQRFIDFVEEFTAEYESIETSYLTRAWVARKDL